MITYKAEYIRRIICVINFTGKILAPRAVCDNWDVNTGVAASGPTSSTAHINGQDRTEPDHSETRADIGQQRALVGQARTRQRQPVTRDQLLGVDIVVGRAPFQGVGMAMESVSLYPAHSVENERRRPRRFRLSHRGAHRQCAVIRSLRNIEPWSGTDASPVIHAQPFRMFSID